MTVTSRREVGDRIGRWLWPALVLLALLAAWETAVRLADTPRWMLPPPTAVAAALRDDRALLLPNAWVTLQEILLGFALALLAGLLTGVAIDSSRTIERALYPLIIASQTIPLVALAPILLIWFGYGLLPKVLVTALVAFFPLAVNTVDGLHAADGETLALLRSLGASPGQRFRLVKLPSALPHLFTGARIAITFSVVGAVFGELVGASAGLGYLMERAGAQFQTARVFAAIVLLALIGVTLFASVALLERLLLPWRRHVTRE
ncbi:MAG: ABC transporter permease [Chloroflexia bacterium]|nr:ABC transporter permease [Chloroflexia bacterium]